MVAIVAVPASDLFEVAGTSENFYDAAGEVLDDWAGELGARGALSEELVRLERLVERLRGEPCGASVGWAGWRWLGGPASGQWPRHPLDSR